MLKTEAELALSAEVGFHQRFLRQGTLVDVGAHVGNFSFQMAKSPGLSIQAIEPLPWATSELRDRVADARLAIQVTAVALSDWHGTATLCVPVIEPGGPVRQWASLVKDFVSLQVHHPEIVDVQRISVPVTTLDRLNLAQVTAIKLDAEGAEYEVLRGARTLLTNQRPILSVELEERHRIGCTFAVPAYLDALGYVAFFLLNGVYVPFSQFDRTSMQRGSRSPASHEYSTPYISCFYFLPTEETQLLEMIKSYIGS